MYSVKFGTVKVVMLVFSKQLDPISLTFGGSVMCERLKQLLKQPIPMDESLESDGNVMFVIPVLLNAYESI